MKERRYLVDTTLRDGEQAPGICFSAKQKLKIAALLDMYGIRQIEAGVPSAGEQEKETIAKIIENRKNAVISTWARLSPSDIRHAIDLCPDLIHVSIPVSHSHIYQKLRKDKDWIVEQLNNCLNMIGKSGIPLSVGFEDAFRAETEFMLTLAGILRDFGVKRIRIADTVGIATPGLCRVLVKTISEQLDGKTELGIHTHNDLGMAAANTVESAKAGCLYADVTIGGIGERAGNCDLTQLVSASSSIFDWGITPADAQILQKKIYKIIRSRFIGTDPPLRA
jgi:homocitrate synthase NifV